MCKCKRTVRLQGFFICDLFPSCSCFSTLHIILFKLSVSLFSTDKDLDACRQFLFLFNAYESKNRGQRAQRCRLKYQTEHRHDIFGLEMWKVLGFGGKNPTKQLEEWDLKCKDKQLARALVPKLLCSAGAPEETHICTKIMCREHTELNAIQLNPLDKLLTN